MEKGNNALLAVAFIAFLGWMLAIGQYGTFAFGLGVLAGSFAAYWLSGLRLSAAGFWVVALSMLALVAVAISWPSDSAEGFWAYAGTFLYGAALAGLLFLLINRYGPSRKSGRESARA